MRDYQRFVVCVCVYPLFPQFRRASAPAEIENKELNLTCLTQPSIISTIYLRTFHPSSSSSLPQYGLSISTSLTTCPGISYSSVPLLSSTLDLPFPQLALSSSERTPRDRSTSTSNSYPPCRDANRSTHNEPKAHPLLMAINSRMPPKILVVEGGDPLGSSPPSSIVHRDTLNRTRIMTMVRAKPCLLLNSPSSARARIGTLAQAPGETLLNPSPGRSSPRRRGIPNHRTASRACSRLTMCLARWRTFINRGSTRIVVLLNEEVV